jgi:hypothetical protein
MRIAALTANDAAQGLRTEAGATIGRITLEGTLFLIAFAGIGSALVGAAFYVATLPWLPRRRALRALAFGGLELALFGTVLLDPGNPDFTILGRPLFNVLVLSTLFVVHGVALVMLVEPSRRLVAAVARGGRWRARLVGVGTSVTMALTAIGASALVARATGGDGRDGRPAAVLRRAGPPGSAPNATDHAADAEDRRRDRLVAPGDLGDRRARRRGGDDRLIVYERGRSLFVS